MIRIYTNRFKNSWHTTVSRNKMRISYASNAISSQRQNWRVLVQSLNIHWLLPKYLCCISELENLPILTTTRSITYTEPSWIRIIWKDSKTAVLQYHPYKKSILSILDMLFSPKVKIDSFNSSMKALMGLLSSNHGVWLYIWTHSNTSFSKLISTSSSYSNKTTFLEQVKK